MDVLSLDEMLVELRIRRWTLIRWGSEHDPALVAATFTWHRYVDVLILRPDRTASGYRTALTPDLDVLRPNLVTFQYHGRALWVLRAVLTLTPPDDTPAHIERPHTSCQVPEQLPRPVVIRPLGVSGRGHLLQT